MTSPQDKPTTSGQAGDVTGEATPEKVNFFHRYSDKDHAPDSQHHTLGTDPNQASPGDHNHDGVNSLKIGASTGTGTGGGALDAATGVILMYPVVTPPVGWLVCHGQAVSRETYSSLFALIGTTYGSGDNSTTFNIPNLRDRFPVGSGNSYAPGNSGGLNSVQLTAEQNGVHSHGVNVSEGGWHQHNTQYGPNTVGAGNSWNQPGYGGAFPTSQDGGHVHSAVASPSVGGQAHENRPPYLALNFIIKT